MERNARLTPEMGRKTNRRWGIIPVRYFRDRLSGLAGPRVKAWHELRGAFRKVIAALTRVFFRTSGFNPPGPQTWLGCV